MNISEFWRWQNNCNVKTKTKIWNESLDIYLTICVLEALCTIQQGHHRSLSHLGSLQLTPEPRLLCWWFPLPSCGHRWSLLTPDGRRYLPPTSWTLVLPAITCFWLPLVYPPAANCCWPCYRSILHRKESYLLLTNSFTVLLHSKYKGCLSMNWQEIR